MAAWSGDIKIVQLLAPFETKLQDFQGRSALMLAAKNGDLEAARLLAPLEAGMQDNDGRTALIEAAEKGHLEIVKLLIPLEAKMLGDSTVTALMISAWHGHADCVRALLPHEAGKRSQEQWSAAACAVASFQRECLATLLADDKEANTIPLPMQAAFKGDVKTMLDARCTWMETLLGEGTILHFAITGGNKRCVRLLLREEEMQKFFAGKDFSLTNVKGDPSKEIKGILPMLLHQTEWQIVDNSINLFFDGKEASARALAPFSSLTRSQWFEQRLRTCESIDTITGLLKLMRNVGFCFYGSTIADMDSKHEKELAELVSRNPIYTKQIELAKKQIPEDDSEHQFSARETLSEAAFNRIILLASRDVSWKSISSQRSPRDERTNSIRPKLERNVLLIRETIRFVKSELRKMMEE